MLLDVLYRIILIIVITTQELANIIPISASKKTETKKLISLPTLYS